MLAPGPRHRLKDLSFNKLIPNILTVLALCAGLTAIRFGLQGRFEHAVVSIVLAGILDALDGRIARMLGGSTKFGAEMDSLADVVDFGVAPAVLLYQWTMSAAGSIGWAIVLLYCVCCALRLARFNTRLGASDLPPWAYKFFTGVPAPAAAGLVLTPMMLSFELGSGFFGHVLVNAVVIVGVSALMVSRVPTYSGKSIRVPQRHVLPLLLLVGLTAGFVVGAPWSTLPAFGLIYVASIPFSYVEFHRLARETAKHYHPANSEE